jgi:hypothetical protein
MSKELTSNVQVGGKWYGPDYPANEVTSDVLDAITNEAAFAPPVEGYGDNRVRHDDFGGQDGAPNLRANEVPPGSPTAAGALPTREELEAKTNEQLHEEAERRGVEVKKSATKDELVDALAPQG